MSQVVSHPSERRSEMLLNDLLASQGWRLERPPRAHLLLQNEYRDFPELREALASASKSGPGAGLPEAILFDHDLNSPLAVVETKRTISEVSAAIEEAQSYAEALFLSGFSPLAVGLAGTEDDGFTLRVTKRIDEKYWSPVTYEENPITWIPARADILRLVAPSASAEIRPTIPPLDVLATRADEINRLLREARVKDEFRPAVVAATMLALWQSRGQVRREPQFILGDINRSCAAAYEAAGRTEVARSIRVDEANETLARKTRRIATILERLNIAVLTAEHDYLGQLYETFFRYTGGNTIGQYFTPRHVTRLMADVCIVGKDDIILDPACGTGGFFVACMDRLVQVDSLNRQDMVSILRKQMIGFEDEPVTAALCIANMMLRGDGSTGVHKDDCFTSVDYPDKGATVVLMNPPFPHSKTDTPVETFVDRALQGLKHRGKLATIVPTGILVKPGTKQWRGKILEEHSLLAVCQLPDELFQPFSSTTTSFVLIEKGVPHDANRKTAFVRLQHDGLTLHKGVRIETTENDIPKAIDAIINGSQSPGFSGLASVGVGAEWASGAYIGSAPADDEEVFEATDVLVRRLASFYTRYSREIVRQRHMIHHGEIRHAQYDELVSDRKQQNARNISGETGQVGNAFDIYYGLSELESRKGIPAGSTLIVSPTEAYNGCYGWLEFGTVVCPPFITVARTGSIGEAFVHLEPCAPNSDCLVLLPRTPMRTAELLLVTAAIRLERWRYNYGRKITPKRIAGVRWPQSPQLISRVDELFEKFAKVIAAALEPYEDHESQ